MAKKVKGADMSVPAEKLESIQNSEGAAKSGFTQNFGPSRVSGYTKGAAKVMSIMKGAADAGHGGPDGHDHPSMTTKSRSTSGGGSSSSESSTSSTSNYDAVVKSEGTKIVDPSLITPAMTAAANAKRANAKKLDVSSTSTSSNASGSSTTSSNTVVSPNSMSETQLQGSIKTENRSQLNAFNRAETNIKAANDSINASNNFLNKLPVKHSTTPKAINIANKKGGRAALKTRVSSGNFTISEAYGINKAGQQ